MMARPTKEGLEYFPLDVDIDQDEKVIMVIAKHGMRGFGVVIRLMMEVYKHGYHYPWTEKEKYIFSMKVNEPVDVVSEIVDECLEWEFFHRGLYESHEILTSKGFQKRYLLAASRRRGVAIHPELDLVSPSKQHENDDNKPTQPELLPAETPQKKRVSTYSEDNLYYKMALYFHHKIVKMAEAEGFNHASIAKADLQKWADDFRKIVEIDKIQDKHLIREVIDWVTADSFWKTNILSTKKLREKFSELALKMKSSRTGNGNGKQQIRDEKNKDLLRKWMEEVRDEQRGDGEATLFDYDGLPDGRTD